jgi:hypothetical protein
MEVQAMRTQTDEAVEKAQVTTIQISIENHGKLCNTADRLAKILHKKKVTPDQVISVMYETNPLDVVLQKLMEEKW